MLHDPQVLLLDEPLSGLDPRARIKMRNLLKRLGDTGKTIIVSSHILPELKDICNKIGIIHKGVMSVNGDVESVMQQVRTAIVLKITLKDSHAKAANLLNEHADVAHVDQTPQELTVTLRESVHDYSELATLLVQNGHRILQFREDELNLETAFMALTKDVNVSHE